MPGLVYGIIASRLPESPRYLVLKGRDAQAEALIHRVQPGIDAKAEVLAIRTAIEDDAKLAKGSTLRGPVLGLKKIVWLGIILSVFQQFVGINVIFYYSTSSGPRSDSASPTRSPSRS